ncbi:MAP kinase kinase Wis1 [Mycoemilia scoparia]|uniref:mitogen-activated protein kinase kinase n=1 Tax=Mycoemilia scoparia TaxID=417184 RepID=A0A9W8A835_9FUNG|nr:MAP kinase kinase Wis1 [Mycoemilia scoparia]
MRRRDQGLNLNQLNNPGSVPAGNSSPFSNFSKYINLNGELNFAGKAVINDQGVNFASGKCYNLNIRELQFKEELGRGRYGVVRKVFHKPTNVTMAMKEIQLNLDESSLKQIQMELDVLHSACSEHIVDFYGAFFVETCVYYCMEYMDYGSLDRLYSAGVPEDVLAKITISDSMSIIHRDVKPTNILVNAKGEIKLCDFGVSGKLNQSLAKTSIGCQSYMAPERIEPSTSQSYTIHSDVWSLGLTVIEVSKATYPYDPSTFDSVFAQLNTIVNGAPPTLDPQKFSTKACDFVAQCLQKVPTERLNYTQMLSHPWLAEYETREVDMESWARRAFETTQGQAPRQPVME